MNSVHVRFDELNNDDGAPSSWYGRGMGGLWALLLTGGAVALLLLFSKSFGYWQYVILGSWYVALIVAGLYWRPLQIMTYVVIALSMFAVWLYSVGQTPDNNWLMRYVLQGDAAAMWMSGFLLFATIGYEVYLFTHKSSVGAASTAMTWLGIIMGFTALGVRWRETYIGHPSWGHIPVGNLWEVMLLFCSATSLFYLFYESRYKAKALGAFVMPLVGAAVLFFLWITFAQHMDKIEPLIPALQSFWIKLHVPMMFIAYANFTIASLVGFAYILDGRSQKRGGRLALILPGQPIMDDIMYAAITFGFLLFTISTILGAVWAAQAWGGFWSWDPKETWSLIVWLNYAGYLHARTVKGWRGTNMAWWSFLSLWVVSFCFLGVNLFLSGLHSYGKL